MEHFKLKLYRTSIEHRRPSINVRSLLPSTNCVTKETISKSANSESFRAKIRDTLTWFPILTILYLVANCFYFHVKWIKAPHFDARTVDSFVLKRDWEAHADPEWPEWFKKYHKCLFYPSRTANGIALSNRCRKVKVCQPMSGFSRYTRSTYVKRQVRPGWTYVRRSSVTLDLIMSIS